MRSPYLTAAVLALAAMAYGGIAGLSSISAQPAGTPPADAQLLRTVRPLALSSVYDASAKTWSVTGEFEYVIPKVGEPGIASDGFGGACLFSEQDKSCAADSDCSHPAGTEASCLSKNRENAYQPVAGAGPGASGGTCWVRQDDAHACLKAGPDLHHPFTLDAKYNVPFDQSTPTTLAAQDKASHLIMVTCLNPPQAQWSAAGPPCATGEPGALHRFGRMHSLPAK